MSKFEVGDRVVMLSHGMKVTGSVTAVPHGLVWVQWDPKFTPLGAAHLEEAYPPEDLRKLKPKKRKRTLPERVLIKGAPFSLERTLDGDTGQTAILLVPCYLTDDEKLQEVEWELAEAYSAE
jgi:hypothetical protein